MTKGSGRFGNSDAEAIIEQMIAWQDDGFDTALATVVSTWGSSPRAVGSHLGVNAKGEMVGSVSGGCVEGAVINEGQEAMDAGKSKLVEFGVTNEMAWEVGLACGGKVRVFVEPFNPWRQVWVDACDALSRRQACVVATHLENGDKALFLDGEVKGAMPVSENLLRHLQDAAANDRSVTVKDAGGDYFLRAYSPSRRLVVVGAVHIAQFLVPMAELAGFSVTVIDPRQAFSADYRFPDVDIRTEWPDEALRDLGLDEQSAVVTLTHDPKLDDPALKAALQSGAFYVGALGSRKTHAGRLARLEKDGILPQSLGCIRGPIGLDIGAQSPAEIAVSILAEIVSVMRKMDGE